MRIVGQNGETLEQALKNTLKEVKDNLLRTAKYSIKNGLVHTTRRHFQRIYPGSTHYSPTKVKDGSCSSGNSSAEGETLIDVPGVTRAYHDVVIRPRHRQYITIPMHRKSYGKRAGEFQDTFVLTKKNGKKFIVQKEPAGITFLYYLATQAFQKQDERLMPSDETYADNIFARIHADLNRQK